MIAPLGFSTVDNKFYRSAYPSLKTQPFISQLNLRTMICLNPADIRDDLRNFAKESNIRLISVDIGMNQEPFLSVSNNAIGQVVDLINDETNRPILLFCSTGKLRSALVVGCWRKSQNWSLTSILQEMNSFSELEDGVSDGLFIEFFG